MTANPTSQQKQKQKQTAFAFRTWGGARRGAGRKQTRQRKSEPHRTRPPFAPTDVAHVVIRVVPALGSLRRWRCYRALNRALRTTLRRGDFRVVHLSIQRTHVHLLVEAASALALARGMQGFQISAAKHCNRALGRARGQVFPDRYHPVAIRTPGQCRHALAYVLHNWKKHGEDRVIRARRWRLDPFSSAVRVSAWADGPIAWQLPPWYEPLVVRAPRTWLLRIGWARGAPIALRDRPRGTLVEPA